MSNVVPISSASAPLAALQEAFCLLRLAGELRVGDRREIADILAGTRRGDVSMYRKQDATVLMKRCLETLPFASNTKSVCEDFFVSPSTIEYTEIAFSPCLTPPSTLNYWVGSKVEPKPGDWSVIREFLRDVICAGNENSYIYLQYFLAHMLQRPEEKPGVMVVLLGGEGIGKGSLFELLGKIWSQTTLQVSDVDHIVGNFNAAIERNYVICMDEAIFSGDRKAADRLKSLITESTVTIEQKHQPRRTIQSHHRFFAASNHQHFSQVGADDRRSFFLRVSEARKSDFGYWEDVHTAITDPVIIAAMVHELLNLDLAGFRVRDRPKTTEHMEQKLKSLTGFRRYWFEVLVAGDFDTSPERSTQTNWDDACFVGTKTLQKGMRVHQSGTRQFVLPQARVLSHELLQICPSSLSARLQHFGSQERGYNLPALSAARAEFEQVLGGKIDWDDV